MLFGQKIIYKENKTLKEDKRKMQKSTFGCHVLHFA